MLKDLYEGCRSRILRTFPERQIYLRSGGEVSYYVFGTKLQLTLTTLLLVMALWCAFTILNVFWDQSPFKTTERDMRMVKAKYERLLEDSRTKEENAQLMLDQQRKNFESMTKSIEEKHATLSQIYQGSGATFEAAPIAEADYASSRVLMSPKIRDVIPRQARVKLIQTASIAPTSTTTMAPSLDTISSTQNAILASAELETLARIEKARAIISSTDMKVDTVLEASPFGKGGIFINIDGEEEPVDDGRFGPRITSIKARIAEAEALDRALQSMPLGHPIDAESYQTSSYGNRRDPFTKRPTFHEGIDFGSYRMAPIVATADGKVSFSGTRGGYGRVVEIDHGHGFMTRYAHLEKTYVKRGKEVKKGEKIAGMGSTGRSTATHLHYEIQFQGRVYDPDKFLKAGNYVQ